jgi:integrase
VTAGQASAESGGSADRTAARWQPAHPGRLVREWFTVAGYRKPHAQVWTDDRFHDWEQTGEHRSVAVWTAQQLGAFLDSVVDDALFAFRWLTALRGLRRGEVCGLRWSDVDLEHGERRTRTGAVPGGGRGMGAADRDVSWGADRVVSAGRRYGLTGISSE